MDYKFCSQCGAKLEEKLVACPISPGGLPLGDKGSRADRNAAIRPARDHKTRLQCPACGFVQYFNPVPAAAVSIVQNGEILLVQRAFEPRKGLWSLPAGFLEADETVEQCAIREVKEETNLDVELTGLLNVYSVFDDPRYICLLVVYTGKILGGDLRCGDDASDAKFFPPSALPKIAWRVHRLAVELGFQREQGP